MRAPAKINLLLGVGAPRPDGFHTLVTVYQAVSLYDDLTAAPADRLTVATEVAAYLDSSHLPQAGHNIVDRAAAALSAHHRRSIGAEVRIDKTIPIAGGLAGGSADGAAALVALDRLHDLHTSDDDLLRLAAGLGSDVPFA
ncbi:MAG: 4-(cytidine 5'-diphospho)-2-C-methyl-D-erythritol kinase, partial [Pseudonocardia sp.]|nr:4-(cytidine 5'-diphospho)-2-C-methyl-D-erythritol kinase [Pseudonocardia sp.]